MSHILDKYNPQSVLERISELVIEHSDNLEKLTEDEIRELRARLATGSYFLVEVVIKPAYLRLTPATLAVPRLKKKAWKDEYDKLIAAGENKSPAKDMASKFYEGNEEYLTALGELLDIKNEIEYAKTLLSAVKEILNSMSAKSKGF